MANFNQHTTKNVAPVQQPQPQQTMTIQEVMRPVVAYVEVRCEEDNRSEGIKAVISGMGAQVNDRLLK